MTTAKAKPTRGTVLFILLTAFLDLAGVGILNPVLPAIAGHYVRPENVASIVGLLFLAYSVCQFIAVPTLGALSDRYGRRPILLISLLGSAAGYLIFGLGGALWMLFLGRMIDGLTGGNVATIYAYAADITEPSERTQFFGIIGAAGAVGFILGPALGGALSLINTVGGYFFMPESLAPNKRVLDIPLKRLNPFTQLREVFRLAQIRSLLANIFLSTVGFAILQSNLSALTETHLGWTPAQTSTTFLFVGVMGILVQGVLVRRLLPRFGEVRLVLAGSLMLIIGFLTLAVVAATQLSALVYVSTFFAGGGYALVTPSITGLLSRSVGATEQGRVQGGNQSVQALSRVIGPLIVAALTVNPQYLPIPYLVGALGFGIGIIVLLRAVPTLKAYQDVANTPRTANAPSV